jgi:hypothetical protein
MYYGQWHYFRIDGEFRNKEEELYLFSEGDIYISNQNIGWNILKNSNKHKCMVTILKK